MAEHIEDMVLGPWGEFDLNSMPEAYCFGPLVGDREGLYNENPYSS